MEKVAQCKGTRLQASSQFMAQGSPKSPTKAAASAQLPSGRELAGWAVVITRPAGTGTSLAQKVRALGGTPVLLPGLSLRAAADPQQARAQWEQAQRDDVLIFTSPAAVRYALLLAPLSKAHGTVVAVGQSTARALHRHGINAQAPVTRQNSEGLLALPPLLRPAGRRIALIPAPGGRGLLQQQLVQRGARLREVHVYQRAASKLNRRHHEAVQRLPATACVLLSSAEALQNLQSQLSAEGWARLCRAIAVVSSERIEAAAQQAGFPQTRRAASATQGDLLAAACEAHARACH